MLQLALEGVRNNPFRYVATVIAIVLGIGFFTATSVLTTSFQDSLNDSIAEAFDDVGAAVRSDQVIEQAGFDVRRQIPASTAAQLRSIDGVSAAAPYLAGYAQVVRANGKTLGGSGAQSQGFGWIEEADLNPFAVARGRAPKAPDEVVVDAKTFADGRFALGERVRILPLPADSPFTIVGTISDESDSFSGQSLAFSFAGAKRVFGSTDVDQIFIEGDEGLSPEQLVSRVSPQLPPGLQAVTGQTLVDEFQELIGQFAGLIKIALQVFAGVALFVGAFVIYNTFAITVAQRTREMGLLRAIGALPQQVSRSILVESLLIGVLASFIGALTGIGLGYALIKLLGSLAGDFDIALSIPGAAMAGAVALGTAITVAAAYLPARRGAKVAPIEALREGAVEVQRVGHRRRAAGLGMLAAGGALTAAALAGDVRLLAVGLPLIVISIVVLGPAIVRPLSRLLAAPIVRNGSITGELARENASRNPRRSATTSLTLMIGVTLVCAATVFGATLSTSTRGDLDQRVLADGVVEIGDAISRQGGGLDPSVARRIAAIGGVDAAVGIRQAPAQIADSSAFMTGIDSAGLDEVLDLDVVAGSVAELGTSRIAVLKSKADEEGLQVGDRIDVRFQQGSARMTVAGIFDTDNTLGPWVVDNAALAAYTNRSLDQSIFVAASGALPRAAIDRVLASDPTAELKSKAAYISDQAGQINNLLVLLYGLLGMSVVVALIGIVNTLGLSIHERTRELGLLRAVGMTTAQLRRTIRYESTLISLIGTLIGLGLGLFLGWTAAQTGDEFFVFTIPWGSLLIIAVAGVAAGLLAGVLPARRAARLDVLEAIATE